jgi:DNA repair exonuclease SbcCD ATPase subunit
VSNDQIGSGDYAETPGGGGTIGMVMAQIPTKALYRLQASVMQEVQSRARVDATNLEVGRGVVEMLQITCDQLTTEKEEEKECTDKLEQGLTMVYNRIPDNVQAPERSAEEKINLISQTIDQYKQEIEELKERLNPMTPPEVREQREQESSLQITEMEKEARKVEELFDRTTQIWTILEEDEKVQQWDQEEETINASIQELKQRQKTMSITERLKGTQDMKKLQTELKTVQTKKQERQAELEPLQEQATQMIAQLEEEKKSMAQAQTEGATLMQEEITTQ